MATITQYVFQRLTRKQQCAHIQAYIDDAKSQAWPQGIPLGATKTVYLEQSKKWFSVESDGTVFLILGTERDSRVELRPDDIEPVSFFNTFPFALTRYVYNKIRGTEKHDITTHVTTSNAVVEEQSSSDQQEDGQKKKHTYKPKPTTLGKTDIAGGRRRKLNSRS